MADEFIVLTGIKETLDALKEFDKDAVRRFNKVLNDELAGAERDARASITDFSNSKGTGTPMSGWRKTDAAKPGKSRNGAGWPGWDKTAIREGIKKTKKQGKPKKRLGYVTSAGALLNESASGAIFEVAGRKTNGTGTGTSFIATLNLRFGKASRSIWRTVDKDRPRIEANVARALEQAKMDLQKALQGERGA